MRHNESTVGLLREYCVPLELAIELKNFLGVAYETVFEFRGSANSFHLHLAKEIDNMGTEKCVPTYLLSELCDLIPEVTLIKSNSSYVATLPDGHVESDANHVVCMAKVLIYTLSVPVNRGQDHSDGYLSGTPDDKE